MSETPLSDEAIKTIIRDYEAERSSLDVLVAQGTLREVDASNGKMYVLPLESGDFPVAISVNNMIVRAGDKVELWRETPGGPVQGRSAIHSFYIDEEKGEIKGTTDSSTPSMLRVSDIRSNISAMERVHSVAPRQGK